MPLHNFGERYQKYDLFNLRENPKDDLEMQYAEEEAEREAEQRIAGLSPNLRRRVALKIAQKVLGDLSQPNPVEVLT